MGALESRIGTVVDGKKYRYEDGPVPIRDGSCLAVGKYILYCEVGTGFQLQERRTRLTAGESYWKIIKSLGSGSAQKAVAEVSTAEPSATADAVCHKSAASQGCQTA